MAKTYGQFCALARALDHVGDRWTMLVVRELLIGPASYGSLQAALEGVPTNLLADRLRAMAADGIVERERSQEDRRRITYRLTALGEALRPAVDALIVWGAHWMTAGPGDDRFEPRWTALALRALFSDRRASFAGTIEFRFATESVRITGAREPSAPDADRHEPEVTIEGPETLLLALASGQLGLDDAAEGGVVIRGDRETLQDVLG